MKVEAGTRIGKGTKLESEGPYADYYEEYLSPDERVLVRFAINEAGPSHWVYEPVITDKVSGKVVFSPDGTWDGEAFSFLSSGHLEMHLRQYPGNGRTVHAVFDPTDWSVTHDLEDEGETTEPAKSLAAKLSAVTPE